jgi:polyribonucleotide nucleotidyltransferase
VNKHAVEFKYGNDNIIIETGELAKQSQASVVVRMGDTVLLATVCASSSKGQVKGFLPLTVESRKKAYASGDIPGGFFKRESKLTEAEILSSRAIDRTIRPCFPKNFYDEVQVLVTVLSLDPEHNADIPAMLGVSAALKLAGLPFDGPVAAVRVGMLGEELVINPGVKQLVDSRLDMIVSGKKDAVLMVEAGAKVLSEEVMLEAILLAQKEMQPAFVAIDELVEKAGANVWDWVKPEELAANFVSDIKESLRSQLSAAYEVQDKLVRKAEIKTIKAKFVESWLSRDDLGLDNPEVALEMVFSECEHELVRANMFATNTRIDKRAFDEVRTISSGVSYLPRSHGSAVFTRGETQALVTVTLGSDRDAQMLDDGSKETFMLHYNFPPFCVGEVGFMGAPKRREIGHGNLAKRALENALNVSDLPYVVRVVSEVLESNGSSSMATVCGGSMALMDAGVKLASPVAGVAMGLMKKADNYIVLTDILGDEDHLGDMDFKVAGTIDGITALQMDIKIGGLSEEILRKALAQAKAGRIHILGEMAKTIEKTSSELSPFAPRVESMQINPDKIRDVIGRGGATIREITETYQVEIDISDEGVVKVCANDAEGLEGALAKIKELTADIEVGQVYTGKVVKIMDFGAFVSIFPGKDGFLHISQISNERVENINDYLAEGQEVVVKAIELDKQGRVRVSMKAASTEIAG